VDDRTAEKIGRNNSIFREANDGIDVAVGDYGLHGGPGAPRVPFLCECSDSRCTNVIRLTRAEYRHVRSNPRWFAHAPGHEAEVEEAVRLLERHDGYIVVEKIGRAGELAAELAPEPHQG
jgi:hypothetical protein